MNINISQIPFSCRGSYMAIFFLPENFGKNANKAGLYLKTVHGSSNSSRISARLVPVCECEELPYEYIVTPYEIKMKTVKGTVSICYANTDTLLFKGDGENLELKIDLEAEKGRVYKKNIHEVQYQDSIYYMLNMYENKIRYIIHASQGTEKIGAKLQNDRLVNSSLQILPENGKFLAVVEEVAIEWKRKELSYDYDAAVNFHKDEFERFYQSMPTVPQRYEDVRQMAAYVNWTSIVKKFGMLTRESMLMSKNWMTNIWSWDHCFNAMALAYNNPEQAWNQFMILFDYQDETGLIPDSINDCAVEYNYCKPPIHGWMLSKMMKVMTLSDEQMMEAYDKLSKWTNWWLNYRDGDQDGICQYYHGNDSGWDNSTLFSKTQTVESPDLTAFLICQMDTLRDLAERLGQRSNAEMWREKADSTMKCFISHCFENNKPKAVANRTHEVIQTESLILYLPIVLGNRLPKGILAEMIKTLKSDKFCTKYGFATESPKSPLYVSDGYWAGPIWAPSTMIILDGLNKVGETEFVNEMAERFCQMIKQSGCAENFDALTGAGLRDRAYTWTSSAFLVMTHEYLM